MVVEVLIDLFHFPDMIRYVLDVNAIFIAVLALPKITLILSDKVFKYFNSYIIIYMAVIVAFSVLMSTPFGRILWATRNNYLYIVFFLCCAYTMKSGDFSDIMRNIARFQLFNVGCAAYEYIALNCQGDALGGMFGIQPGCNGLLNNYLFIITIWAIVMFQHGKISLPYLLWIIVSSVALAAAAELKFYFIELAFIILANIALSRANIKNGFLVIVAVVLFFVAIQIVSQINPDIVRFFSNFDTVTTYSTENYGNTTISRGTAIAQINSYFFHHDKLLNLFGYGFGSCESSQSFAWANSSFANHYSYLGYRNLSVSMIFLETGYAGLIGFIAIFVLLFIFAQKYKDKVTKGKDIISVAQITSLLAIANIWYNSCIRRETAYLTFFVLAGLLIAVRERDKKESENNGDDKNRKRIKIRIRRRIKFI